MSRILSELEQEQSKPKKSMAPSKKKKEENSDKKEKRDKRVQIVLTQSLYDELTETRWKNKTKSLNEAIIQAIEQYIERSK